MVNTIESTLDNCFEILKYNRTFIYNELICELNEEKSFKNKRNDLLGGGGGGGLDITTTSSHHSFDSSSISKKTSLTNDYLNKMNPSIRRWSEQTNVTATAAASATTIPPPPSSSSSSS